MGSSLLPPIPKLCRNPCASGPPFVSVYGSSSPMQPRIRRMKMAPGPDRRVWPRTTQKCGLCCRRRRTDSAVVWSLLLLSPAQ
ncbi:hypothetical protein ATANTOWER_011368 [Ataeniobius toweri]|uniref:Uncharacterized protein n=1 Tax=Ataeniobius toweri TaxID=208326 RepID=A0ABU7A5N8_9TELE|nr:hypothetical protein [Ataeniobius toweri]